jgi:hypothetical protein
MSVEQPVVPRTPGRVTPIRAAPPRSPDPAELAERAIRTAVGVASLAAEFLATSLADAIRGEGREPVEEVADDESWPKPLLPVLTGAAFGVTIEAAKLVAGATAAVGRSLGPWVSFAASPTFVRERLGRVRTKVDELDAEWAVEQNEDERIGSTFVRELVPQVLDATLDQIDLTELVLERVDLDRVIDSVDLARAIDRIDLDVIVGRIDIDAIVQRVDVNGIVERVDLDAVMSHIDIDAIVQRVDIDAIVQRVDVNGIVERVDLDAVTARIDVEAIVQRLDLAKIAQEVVDQLDLATIAMRVIEEIDLPAIVRESTGTMANETVEGIRAQSMNADQAMGRIVDRLLGRKADRDDGSGGA